MTVLIPEADPVPSSAKSILRRRTYARWLPIVPVRAQGMRSPFSSALSSPWWCRWSRSRWRSSKRCSECSCPIAMRFDHALMPLIGALDRLLTLQAVKALTRRTLARSPR
jgi:hypothetical protein